MLMVNSVTFPDHRRSAKEVIGCVIRGCESTRTPVGDTSSPPSCRGEERMNYIGKFISNFKDFYNEINAATLTGGDTGEVSEEVVVVKAKYNGEAAAVVVVVVVVVV
ncbi:hypothetical protein E2C01_003811 [Portunus trituberculatus]|uniref:Uncharacterized protein n=1 Tax=Portunus trituberculatus TaxID=210409 RepID=A0A5B7CUP4_PORTR|nr:hypothetical protein [Portunus trituberculatus]